MKFVRQGDDIPELCQLAGEDPFSDNNLEKAFRNEYQIKCLDKKKILNSKIEHKSVMLICYDIYKELIMKAETNLKEQE